MGKKTRKKLKKSKSKKIIIKKCGLDRETIEIKLMIARKNGMKYKRFLLNRAWELSNDEIIELNQNIEKYMEEKKDDLDLLKLKTKMLKEEIVAKKFIANRYNISDKTFFARKIYLIKGKDFDKYVDALKKIKENKEEEKEFYTQIMKKRTGWTLEKTISEMNNADKIGVDYNYYTIKGAYAKNDEEMKQLAAFAKVDKARIIKNANEYFDKICKVTKWNVEKAELKTRIAKAETGCSYEDYYAFKFYKLNTKKQKEYITLSNFKKMRVKYNEHHKARDNFDDKGKFNETFKKYINRVWFLNTDLTYEEFKKKTKNLKKIFVKPIASTQGIGIKKFNIPNNERELKKIYEQIINMPKSIVEEYIIQHNEIMNFCDKSVNTVRITTLNNNGKCEYLYSVFRMGQGNIVDNFHAGGIAATIDIKTGRVITNASDLEGKIFKKNTYSNKKIKNFKIPHWNKIIKTCEKIYCIVDDVNLIGWDFAITPDGVELIEGNPGASYVVAQIPNIETKKGLNYIMAEKYLKGDNINENN